MYALEITFTDGVSQSEMIFVRRPQALVGASEYAHVVVDDMRDLDYQLRIYRGLGRNFTVRPIGLRDGVSVPEILQGVYVGEASLDVGPVIFGITTLDSDLLLKDNEPPDRAGVRILRQACSQVAPQFPAVVIPGNESMVVSFVPDQPMLIGRSNSCALRLDSSDISAKHARIGYESGAFWIEDLGSTNGTFVDGQQVSGRVTVEPGHPIVLGRDVALFGAISEEQVRQATTDLDVQSSRTVAPKAKYPILISTSEVARPAKLVLFPGSVIQVGRDPSGDIWLGAPHVSRKHCSFELSKTGVLSATDHSMNGVAFDQGFLGNGATIELANQPSVFNFGGGITLAVCFAEDQEEQFVQSQGSPDVFLGEEESARLAQQRQAKSASVNLGNAAGGTVVDTEQFRRVYRRLSFQRKLLLMFSGFLFLLALLFVMRLLLPVFM